MVDAVNVKPILLTPGNGGDTDSYIPRLGVSESDFLQPPVFIGANAAEKMVQWLNNENYRNVAKRREEENRGVYTLSIKAADHKLAAAKLTRDGAMANGGLMIAGGGLSVVGGAYGVASGKAIRDQAIKGARVLAGRNGEGAAGAGGTPPSTGAAGTTSGSGANKAAGASSKRAESETSPDGARPAGNKDSDDPVSMAASRRAGEDGDEGGEANGGGQRQKSVKEQEKEDADALAARLQEDTEYALTNARHEDFSGKRIILDGTGRTLQAAGGMIKAEFDYQAELEIHKQLVAEANQMQASNNYSNYNDWMQRFYDQEQKASQWSFAILASDTQALHLIIA